MYNEVDVISALLLLLTAKTLKVTLLPETKCESCIWRMAAHQKAVPRKGNQGPSQIMQGKCISSAQEGTPLFVVSDIEKNVNSVLPI
jgi:hypothetical protein